MSHFEIHSFMTTNVNLSCYSIWRDRLVWNILMLMYDEQVTAEYKEIRTSVDQSVAKSSGPRCLVLLCLFNL